MTTHPPETPPLLADFFEVTDTGLARLNNEDSVATAPAVGLMILADGMGGYNAGEVASGMTCTFIKTELGRWLEEAMHDATDAEVSRAMEICTDNANRAVFNASVSDARYAGMGTTLVLGVLREGRCILGHIGDSRAYLMRGQTLTQVTRDHSLLQEQLDAGLITPEQASVALHKNLVTRALGVDLQVDLELHTHEVAQGDILLMCSDGLTDMVAEETIADILHNGVDLSQMGQALVRCANDAGGRDNISVILARVGPYNAGTARNWWTFGRS